MTVRAIFLIALAAFIFTDVARAGDAPKLPSRKAEVVLPLLKQFSQTDTYPKVEEILGKPDMDIGSGLYIFVFRLDDLTTITVETADRNSVFGISRTGHGVDGTQVIFRHR